MFQPTKIKVFTPYLPPKGVHNWGASNMKSICYCIWGACMLSTSLFAFNFKQKQCWQKEAVYPFYHLSHISATLTGFMLINFFFRFLILHTMQQKGSYCVETSISGRYVTSKHKSSSHKQKQVIKSQTKTNYQITSKPYSCPTFAQLGCGNLLAAFERPLPLPTPTIINTKPTTRWMLIQ